MSALPLVFAGTPAFAVPALQALIDSPYRPLAVLTQPDRGAGRGRKVRASPVKECALDAGIPVHQPASLRDPAALEPLRPLAPKLLVTAAYGLLLPRAVLDWPEHGCWNLHASLLPRWRGASPINQAILAGDRETGISLMQMDSGLDTGPVLLHSATAIGATETAGELHDRLAPLAAKLLLEGIEGLLAGRLPEPRGQDPALATHAPLIDKRDAELDWAGPAEALDRQVRAYNPWPVAFADIEGQPCRVHRARAIPELAGEPGRLIRDPQLAGRILVGCGQGALEILVLQAPGRKPQAASDWLNAHPDWR